MKQNIKSSVRSGIIFVVFLGLGYFLSIHLQHIVFKRYATAESSDYSVAYMGPAEQVQPVAAYQPNQCGCPYCCGLTN